EECRKVMAICLDIVEVQALINFPLDADGLEWHWRVLFIALGGGRWIIGTPDGEVYEEAYAGVAIQPLARAGAYPAALWNETYAPDAAILGLLPQMRLDAQGLGLILGVAPAVVAGAAAAASGRWLISDVDHKDFSSEVLAAELLNPATTTSLAVGTEEKKLHVYKGGIVTLEYVEDTSAWTQQKRPGLPGGHAGDLRLLGNQANSSGKRMMSLSRALELMTKHTFADWPHRGPAATKEFLEAIMESGGDIQVYLGTFMRKSGVSDNTACCHELKNLFEMVRLGISYDQIDVGNLASFELIVRRILEIQTAIRRNPQHPIFDGLDQSALGSVDEVGGARAVSYGHWLGEQQKAEAKLMRGQREYREEQISDRKGRSGPGGEAKGGAKGDKNDSKKKKKSDKGGGPSAAGDASTSRQSSEKILRAAAGGSISGAPRAAEECMRGGRHGDAFPMHPPGIGPAWNRAPPQNGTEVLRGAARSRGIRLAEGIRSLNALANCTARSVRGHTQARTRSCPTGYSATQQSVLSRCEGKIERYGPCPAGWTPRGCFDDVPKTNDMYSLESRNVAPYLPELLKVTKGGTTPKPAQSLLPPVAAAALRNPETHIIRSEIEMQRWREENPGFVPHWDETLRKDRKLRVDLYRTLYERNLVTLRRKIKAKVAVFFVWKSSKKGIRMIVDARMPNAFHKRPPRTRLGGGGALAELDAYLDEEEWEMLRAGLGDVSDDGDESSGEAWPELVGDTGDVEDAFYQFDVEELCEWFGFDDPVTADEMGISSLNGESVRGDEVFFPCFKGMPQGWSWALHFCQEAVKHRMALGLGSDSQLVEEGLPAPSLLGGPVGSVYVDNLAILGHDAKEVHRTFGKVKTELQAIGFTLHELCEGEEEVENVGLVIDRKRQLMRHKNGRAWRLYLGLKYLLSLRRVTGEVIRVFVGHVVHYFTLLRPAMSILAHTYKFAFANLGRTAIITDAVKWEFRMIMGLIFLAEVDLAAAHSGEMGCGDASGDGYAFMSTQVSLAESRELHKFNERWRFVDVEVDRGGVGAPLPGGWSADLEVPKTSYGTWLCAEAGLPQPGSGVLESHFHNKGTRRKKDDRVIKEYELVGIVPRLSDAICCQSRWVTHKEGRWRYKESIHLTEGRTSLMSLRRMARVVEHHGKRYLTLSDNLSSLCAFAKGRAKTYDLTALCRRSAALQIGCDIRWRQRYIESERNPCDEGSRRKGKPAFANNAVRECDADTGGPTLLLERRPVAAGILPTVTSAFFKKEGAPLRHADGPSSSSFLGQPAHVSVVEKPVERVRSTRGLPVRRTAIFKSESAMLSDVLRGPTQRSSNATDSQYTFRISGNPAQSKPQVVVRPAFPSSPSLEKATASDHCGHMKPPGKFRPPARGAKVFSSMMPPAAPAGLELFAGSGRFTRAMLDSGLRVMLPFELKNGGVARWSWKTSLAGEYAPKLVLKWVKILHSLAPSGAFRVAHEPRLLPGLIDELEKVTGSSIDIKLIDLSACPSEFCSPWKDKVEAVRLFQVFAVTMGVLSLTGIDQVDAAMEKYFELLFVRGVSQYAARCALYGWAYLHPTMSTKPRHHFPLSKAALKGWKNLEPGGSKDPCPWEVALLIAEWMMANGYVKMAAFVILCFDTYVRPGILSLIRRENILPPVPGVNASYKHWSLVLSPKTEGVPTKVGEFDDSLIVGSTGREWVSQIAELLWRKSLPNALFFPFSLREIEKVFKLATTALSVMLLHVTPRSLRHGGPSHDVYFNIRNLDQVQRRGFWKALSSVRRYEKHACLQ
ncbi:unnamed protein product, partial [Polarella glacialis]